jgi:hypothetical protein
MRAVLALALIAAAGVGLERAADGPDLRAVGAPAAAIETGRGTLLGAMERRGVADLVRLRPGTLRRVGAPLRLRGDLVADSELSPDGRLLAVGDEFRNRVQIVDLRRWRVLRTIVLPGPRPGGYGGASALAWPSPRRLAVLSGAHYTKATPIVIDPVTGRTLRRSGWHGAPLQSDSRGGRMVVLASASNWWHGPARSTLAGYDAAGRLRTARLDRILAGSGERGTGPARDLTPALAVDWRAERAYVVATDDVLVAEVSLRSWRVRYHRLTEHRTAWGRLRDLVDPPAHAKGEPVHVRTRIAEVLPNGAIAVTGEDRPATEPSHLSKPIPFGLRLIDPRTWTVRTVDAESQDFTLAGGTILARRFAMGRDGLEGIGVRAYDSAGKRRWEAFGGADTIVRGAAGRRAYVEVRRAGRRPIHVIDLESGRTERRRGSADIRVLDR